MPDVHFVALLDGRVLLDTITASPLDTVIRALPHLPDCQPPSSLTRSDAESIGTWIGRMTSSGRVAVHRIRRSDIDVGPAVDV